MEQARAAGPLALHAFLAGMPKGGDLHNHLGGAVYAETWLRDAAADHVCIDPKALDFVQSWPRTRHRTVRRPFGRCLDPPAESAAL